MQGPCNAVVRSFPPSFPLSRHLFILLALAAAPLAEAQTQSIWKGTAGSTWDTTTTANWSNGIPISNVGGVEAVFNNAAGLLTTIPIATTGVSSEGLIFNPLSYDYTFTGGPLTIDNGGITDYTAGAQTFDQNVTINASSVTSLVSIGILFGAGGNNGQSTINSTLTFADGLTLGNNAQFTFGGVNGYLGTVNLDGAFVNNNLTAGAAFNFSNGGTLNWDTTSVTSPNTIFIKNSYAGTFTLSGVSTAYNGTSNLYTDPGTSVTFGGGGGVGGVINLMTNGLIVTSAVTPGGGAGTELLQSDVAVTGNNTAETTISGLVSLPTGTSNTDTFQFSAASGNTLLVFNVIGGGAASATGVAVQKTGAGTVVFGATNTYLASSTSVNAGTLVVQGTGASLGKNTGFTTNVNVAAGAALDYDASSSAQLTISGNFAVTGGTGTILGGAIGSTATGAEINVAGVASVTNAPLVVNIYGVSGVSPVTGTNTYTLVAGGAGSTLNGASSYTLGNVYNASDFTVGALSETATAINVAITSATANPAEYWNGGFSGGNNVWAISDGSTASNWVTAATGGATSLTPGSTTTIFFSDNSPANSAASTVLGANMTIAGLVINDPNGVGLNGDGNTLTIGSGGITDNSGAGAVNLGSLVSINTAETWTNDSSNALTLSGQVLLHTFNLALAGTGAVDFTNDFSESSGTLTDTDSGGVTISGPINLNNGVVTWTNNSSAPLTISGPVTMGSGSLTFGGSGNTSVSGALYGTGTGTTLTQNGTGTVTLSGSNNYGSTQINAGTVRAANNNALGLSFVNTLKAVNATSIPSVVTVGGATQTGPATLDLYNGVTVNQSIAMKGNTSANTANLINSASGTTSVINGGVTGVTFSAAPTNLAANTTGTFTGGGGAGGTASVLLGLTSNSFAVTSNTTTYTVAPTVTISGGGGTGATATAILNGSGQVTGITIVNKGVGYNSISNLTLAFSGGTILASGTNPTATAVDNNFTLIDVNETASGSGYSSTPTLTLSSGGGTGLTATATAETVALTGTNNNIGGAGNLQINSAVTGTGGGFAKIGSGTLTLSGANTYTGGTTIGAGQVLATNLTGSATGTGAITVASGAILGGTGTLNPTGSNTLLVQAGGILAPGLAGSTGVLTVSAAGNTTSGLVALSGAQLNFNLNSGHASSELSFTGSFAGELTGLSGNTFNFTDLSGGNLATGDYTLILTDLATSGSSPFTGLALGQGVKLTGFTLTGLGGDNAQLELNSVGGDYALQLDILSVPEPSVWILLWGGAAMLAMIQFRRRAGTVL